MAKGKLGTPILGLSLGIQLKDASTGPFAQFQNCGDDEESLTKLVFQLVDRIPNSEPDRDTIKFQVEKFRVRISEILGKTEKISPKAVEPKSDASIDEIENSSARLFEEIKVMFQDLPSRIDRLPRSDNKRRRRKFHPMMVDELMHSAKNPKLGLKIALSFYKEKMPWIYDEGIALINKASLPATRTPNKKIWNDFEELLMSTVRNPVIEELFVENEEDYFLLQEMPRIILRGVERLLMEQI